MKESNRIRTLAGQAASPARRRLLVQGASALLMVPFARRAAAQEYPARPVKIIVPYVAGGQGDNAIRVLAAALTQQLGQSFVVENLSGGSGIPAMQAALKANPDGHTLAYADPGQWAINPALYAQLPYDILRDFMPIRMFGLSPLFIVVPASSPANNLQELVAMAKARPDALSYASSGVGSPHHMVMEDLKARLGLKILHVPYRGTAQSIPAVLAGDVNMGVSSLVAVSGFVKDGRLKLLGVTGTRRSQFAPTVPTIAEAVAPGFDQAAGFGVMAPVRTPRAVVDKLSEAIGRVLANPEVTAKLLAIGVEPVTDSSPERMAERIRDERTNISNIAKRANIKLD